MPRDDLLALSDEDLVLLTNKGTVRRARKELDRGEPTGAVRVEEDGRAVGAWSDATCTLPPGEALDQQHCDCPAPVVCRHLVRTVLALQAAEGTESAGETRVEPWDPGAIPDEALATHGKARLSKLRKRFEKGLLVELVRSRKPVARILDLACSVRFLAPGSAQLVHCDCGAPPPCEHVPLAVWAFRLLPAERTAGLLSTSPQEAQIDGLTEAEAEVVALVREGLSGNPTVAKGRLRRLEEQTRRDGWLWPGELCAALVLAVQRYDQQDARFDPGELARLLGELLARFDAMRGRGDLPPAYVRGVASAANPSGRGHQQLIGLGCAAVQGPRAVELQALLQDVSSGAVFAVARSFVDPEEDEPTPLYELARRPGFGTTRLDALGASRLQLRGGKRGADQRLSVGRAQVSVTPQELGWEQDLHPAAVCADLAELRARLEALPPFALRPRRVAEDVVVCAVASACDPGFVVHEQAVVAELVDAEGETAQLWHPYTSRGREGAERLLATLTSHGDGVRFVTARARPAGGRLVLHPIALVVEANGRRELIQPWVDRLEGAVGLPDPPSSVDDDPLHSFRAELIQALGQLVVAGLTRAGRAYARSWSDLYGQAEGLGLDRLAVKVRALSVALEQRQHVADWDPGPALEAALELLVLARLAEDIAS